MTVLQEDPAWQAAMQRRGITDLDSVQIDPWPAGAFGSTRMRRAGVSAGASPTSAPTPEDNGYARPIEGVIGFVDMARGEVLEVVDTGVIPFPPESGGYYPEDVGEMRRDLKPIEITQPEGASFDVEGNLVRWQRWSLRVTMDAVEGLVLHEIATKTTAGYVPSSTGRR